MPSPNTDEKLTGAPLSAGTYQSFVVRVWSTDNGVPQFEITHIASREGFRSRDPETVVAFMLQRLPAPNAT